MVLFAPSRRYRICLMSLFSWCWQSLPASLVLSEIISYNEILMVLKYFPPFFFCLLLLLFWGPHPQYMEVPRLGVKLELQLLASVSATAVQGSKPHLPLTTQLMAMPVLNPLSEARDGTHILMDTSWVCYCWATTETPVPHLLYPFFGWWTFMLLLCIGYCKQCCNEH